MAAKKSPPKKSAVTQSRAKKSLGTSAQTIVDEQLARYRSMRDFGITEEPSGSSRRKTSKNSLPFVIQKHAASHLHYDFRLGWNGVLKSWAIAKGPSYYTGDRRLAVQVEDHPMEYGGFEGIIPKGQYGGGTVMVWDQGTWEPQSGYEDVNAGLKSGSLKFVMNGTKMKGKWTLVRMNNTGRKGYQNSKPNWLLIKEHDEFERNQNDPTVTEEEQNSVITGRSLDQIASAETHIWESNRANKAGKSWHHGSPPIQNNSVNRNILHGTPKEKIPDFIPPQLADHVAEPPSQGDWIHELKLDGYRIQARKIGDRVELRTRSGLNWTHRMKTVAEAIKRLNAENAIMDGEVVVLDKSGNSSFAKLQASFEQGEKHPLNYFVFDLLHLNGHNTRNLPLVERKRLLLDVLPAHDETLRYNEHLEEEGAAVFHRACDLGAEGTISKRADAKYTTGRNNSWVKSKCLLEQEFIVGGFTLPSNGSHGIGSLLLGYYKGKQIIYAGRTGTGFTQKTHRMLRNKLEALKQKAVPFAMLPAEARRGAIWVKPSTVVQVRFATWTTDNLVRQAAYLGLREDKSASEVIREPTSLKPKAATGRIKSTSREPKTVNPKSRPMKIPLSVRLTHPDKILDEATKLTKQELAEYYWSVAEHMLPHIANRPLSLVRCPEGSGKPCFYQKHTSHTLPPGVGSVMIKDKKSSKPEPYITLNTPEALAGLAQMGVLEIHPWGSQNTSLETPDRIIIDLDPDPSISWRQLADSALHVRKMLQSVGVESFLKTTGGKGLHIVFPIEPRFDWSAVKSWARAFAGAIEHESPNLYLIKMTKAARKGKIFVDYLRNERGATAVAPFSPRAREGAPVSLPLAWTELNTEKRPSFSVRDFDSWKHRLLKDPWKKLTSLKQTLPGA